MDIKKTVSQISSRPMDRREFLASAGAVALTVIGVSSILRTLGSGHHFGGNSKGTQSSGAYGASPYGGEKRRLG